MTPLTFLYTAVMVAILFGGTVFVHELGHFLTAKWFKLRVDAFSIGMGPVLWQKVVNGTSYRISLLPIGGYVALPQMDITGSAFENEDAKAGKLQEVDPWKRIVIAAAGPFMNVLAAFVLAGVIWIIGKPFDPNPGEPLVGHVEEDSLAWEAGLREGDFILEANGDTVNFWVDLVIAAGLNPEVTLRVDREGETLDIGPVPTERNRLGMLYLDGVFPVDKTAHVEIGELLDGFPAADSGLRRRDILYRINGEEVTSGQMFWQTVQRAGEEAVEVTVLRGRRRAEHAFTLQTRDDGEGNRLIGIRMRPVQETVHPRPMRQMRYFSGTIARTFRGLARPRERREAAGQIGGPAMMIGGFGHYVGLGLSKALWFTALINVNLAIVNLLPLVILDGGHITLALFEMVTRCKIPRKIIILLANIVVVLLISLMVFLTFRDARLFWRQHQIQNERPEEQTEAVENETPDDEVPDAFPEMENQVPALP